jgi:Bacterial PH domain
VKNFDYEPIPGLPGELPPGETLLWQGKPDWWCLARRVFHLPLIAGYLGLFMVWRLISAAYDGQPLLPTAESLMYMALLTAACSAILAGLAYATARTTVYSITSERVVMRYGIALPMALNLPFGKVETAAAAIFPGGCGDIPLRLNEGEKISYLMLWPHARPWRISRPEPALRGVPKVEEVTMLLGRALAAAASRPSARAKAASPAPAIAAASAPAPVHAKAAAQAQRPLREAPNPAPEPVARLA